MIRTRAFISQVASQSCAEQIQVYYQLLLNGKKDLLWAPEAKLGFEMVLLRLLAFEPSSHVQSAPVNQNTAMTFTPEFSQELSINANAQYLCTTAIIWLLEIGDDS